MTTKAERETDEALRALRLAALARHPDACEIYMADALLHMTRAIEAEGADK